MMMYSMLASGDDGLRLDSTEELKMEAANCRRMLGHFESAPAACERFGRQGPRT